MSKQRKKDFCDFFEYKHILNKIFFNRYDNMKLTKTEVDEFWIFLRKYLNVKSKKEISNTNNSLKVKDDSLTKLNDIIPKEWNDVDFIKSQLNKLKCQTYLKLSEVFEFRDILLNYVNFIIKRKEKKLEKLKVFQTNLPIYKHQEEIIEHIQNYSVILVAGDTGCGKSTQIPQYLLNAGYENICCTQPRRIACISLRNRLAFETLDKYGSEIGYHIRFEKLKSKSTKILFLTEGLLLRQMIEDPLLSQYSVIILDEIHERHLSCDFLLGAIKCLLNRRKNDLKVILMSATVNCDLFSSYFGNCPVIKVPGRLYPIKTEYFPVEKFKLLKSNSSKISPEPYLKLLRYIDEKYSASERGDVLVFLSGFMEIETVGEALKNYAEQTHKWIILYLHSSLSIAEQDKVFDLSPDGVRKCILSTNIAETSLTIDGIRFVIDSGKVKEMNYDSKIRMHKLQEIWISKASAEQRKGRAGRTGPGVCYRLYTPEDFKELSDFSTPEIQRVSLESLILNMISMGLNDVRKFPFLEAPNLTNIENTLQCLINYGTLEENERITLVGRILSKLPVDISIGKMLILAVGLNLVEYLLSVAACLSISSLITNRSMSNSEAIEERKRLFSMEGDLFTHICFYSKWLMLKSENLNTRSWCRKLGLEEQRFFEITKLRNQFKQILQDTGLVEILTNADTKSKAERIQKHGERKLYRQMKSEQEKYKNKKRKLLNRNDDVECNDEDNSYINFKDMEFKLLFDQKHLMDIENRHKLSSIDMDIVKLIVSISFYPQLAISDPDNSFRTDCDQIFHTKEKPFVVLHPSSVYYNEPEVLKPIDIEHSSMGILSAHHFLLGYISFIETSKTYICNCYKVSAAHALLLSARQIDTNQDCSRLVCDSWIELQYINCEESQDFMLQAAQIRQCWTRFLELVFDGLISTDNNLSNENTVLAPNCDINKEVKFLRHKLKKYLKTRYKYAIKRLFAADLKHLYNHCDLAESDLNQRDNKLVQYMLANKTTNCEQPSSNKGGIRWSFITYDCLSVNEKDELLKSSRKLFKCSTCKKEMYLNNIEQCRHRQTCGSNIENLSDDNDNEEPSDSKQVKKGVNPYFCAQCNKELYLSNIDILKHRRAHQ